jgi:hypothetical protein
VFDTSNALLGSTTVADVVDMLENAYLGIELTDGSELGRVNVAGTTFGFYGADNIRVFTVPEPASAGLLGALVGCGVLIRRRHG